MNTQTKGVVTSSAFISSGFLTTFLVLATTHIGPCGPSRIWPARLGLPALLGAEVLAAKYLHRCWAGPVRWPKFASVPLAAAFVMLLPITLYMGMFATL